VGEAGTIISNVLETIGNGAACLVIELVALVLVLSSGFKDYEMLDALECMILLDRVSG
jgi:hypothetical protein